VDRENRGGQDSSPMHCVPTGLIIISMVVWMGIAIRQVDYYVVDAGDHVALRFYGDNAITAQS
jgi:hypothetical protein